MDRALPLDIALHLDYAPYDEDLENRGIDPGWDPEELRTVIQRAVRNALAFSRTVRLVDTEII